MNIENWYMPIILTSINPLLVFLSSILIGKFNLDKPNDTDIHFNQLKKVFEPIVILLDKNGEARNNEIFDKIEKIIYENYALVPDIIIKEINSIKEDETKCFDCLHEIIISNYNWSKKKLRYPFDKKLINKKYISEDNKFLIVKTITGALLILVIFIIWVISTPENIDLIATVTRLISIIGFIYAIFFVAIYFGLRK